MTNSNKNKKDDESGSIMFIGKYDVYLHQLEEKVIKQKINVSSQPNVVKYSIEGCNWDAWVISGNVKPTFLLKKLISQMKIIIFVFNAQKQETLMFLNEGWFHIVKQSIEDNQSPIRLLYGTQINNEIDLKKLAPQIKETVDKFKCNVFSNIKITDNIGFKVNYNLFDFLNDQFSFHKKQENKKSIQSYNDQKQIEKKGINAKDKPANIIENNDKKKDKSKNEYYSYKSDDDYDEEYENTEEEDPEENDVGEGEVFTPPGNIVYRLFDKYHIAHVIESPKANGDISIPRNVQFKSSKYTVTRICEKAFQGTEIKSLSFAPYSKVRKICNLAFNKSLLESLSIPSSLNKIEEQSFYGCDNLKKIEIDKKNNYFINRKEFLLYKNKTENKNAPSEEMIFSLNDYQFKNNAIKFIRSQKLFSFNVYSPPFNTDIFRKFIKCQNILYIELIYNQKIEIKENCFYESKNIKGIRFVSKDLNVNNFGFRNLRNVSLFHFEKLVKAKFGSNAFSGCESLQKFEIATSSELELCDECFHGNINLQELKVKSPSVIIGEKGFMGCNSLSSVSFLYLKSIKIGSNAFSGCESLKELKLKVESNLEFEEYCFSRASNLQRVEITGIKSLIIEQGSFENCPSLTSISFPDAIEVNFGRKSFSGCTKLNKISLPKAESICFEEFCFERDKNISPIDLNCINLTIHENSFDKPVPIPSNRLNRIRKLELHINNLNPFSSMIDQCKSLESITIKINQIGSIAQNSFNKIGFNLRHVNLITKEAFNLEKEIFAKLNKLEAVQIASPSLTITSNCFNEAKNLQEFEFQGEQLTIEESCFKNCRKLTKFSLSNICYVRISSRLFEGCGKLNSLIIKPTTKIVLSNFFDNKGEIGSGQSGISYLAIEKETNQTKRVKTLQAALRTLEELRSFFFHMIPLSSVKSPVVSAIHGFHFIDFGPKLQPTIVTDYIRGLSLEEAFSNMNKLRLTGTQRYIILLGITIGMEYLHSNNIIHNNLTPSNIILDEKFFPHINDYSMMNPNGNTYTAPEIFNDKPFSYEADVYSYSIIAYELITCKRPFEGYKMNDFIQNVIKKGERPDLKLIQDKNIQTLLNRCWSAAPSNRPSISSVLDEIINEQYINTFGANRFEVETYLRNFGIKLKYAKEKPKNAKSGMNIKLSGCERSLEVQKQIEPQPKISQSSNNSKNSELIITRYLRSILFDEKVPIKRFSISDKTKLSGNLIELSDKILKPGKKIILFFTIEHASNYIVKYYKDTDPIHSLGSYLNIQIKPAIGKEYRICVLCDISKINNDTDINRDCFTFAIAFIEYPSVQDFINRIMSYIDPSKKAKLPNPQLYAFKNSKFINITKIRDIQNKEMPIFVSWGGKQYNHILDFIYDHVLCQDGFDL